MLNETNLSKYLWANAVSTACYIMNHVLIIEILKRNHYELYKGRNLIISHLHVFGCRCFILNNEKDNLINFDAKDDEDIFIRYSTSSKTFKVFNKRTLTSEESIHVTFDESNTKLVEVEVVDCACILEKKNL